MMEFKVYEVQERNGSWEFFECLSGDTMLFCIMQVTGWVSIL